MCLALSPAVSNAVELPPVSDPQVLKIFERYRSDIAKFSDPAYLAVPATPAPWPCAFDQETMYEAAGLGEALPGGGKTMRAIEKKMEQSNREAGFGVAAFPIQNEITDVVLVPLQAQCENGKLHGTVEVLSGFTQTHLDPASGEPKKVIGSFRHVQRVFLEFDQGARVSKAAGAAVSLNQDLLNPQFNKSLPSVTYFSKLEDSPSDNRIVTISQSPHPDSSAAEMMVMIMQSTGPNRKKMEIWTGATKTTETNTLNDLAQGPQMSAYEVKGTPGLMGTSAEEMAQLILKFPGNEMARKEVVNGRIFIVENKCSDKGVEVVTTQCNL